MTDYYPMMNRAISGLEHNSTVARKAVYQRARTAQLSQLQKAQPPLTKIDFDRERLALETAINRIEEEQGRARLEALIAAGSPYETNNFAANSSPTQRIVEALANAGSALAAIFRSGRPSGE